MSNYPSEAQATTRARAWTWAGVLVALGGSALAIAAKRTGYFGSEVVGSTVLNWFALWSAASLTLLILVLGERQPLSAIGFRRFTWKSLDFGIALAVVVIMICCSCRWRPSSSRLRFSGAAICGRTSSPIWWLIRCRFLSYL
jgi:hypothetical protein